MFCGKCGASIGIDFREFLSPDPSRFGISVSAKKKKKLTAALEKICARRWLLACFFSFFISFSVFKFFFLRCISTVQGEKSASMLTICCSVYRSGRSTESISTRSSIDRPRARSLSNQPGICRGSGTSSMRRRRPRRKRQSRTRRNWLRRRQQLDRKRGLMGGFFFTGLALKIFYLSWQNRLLQTPSFTMKLAGRKQDSLGYELMLFMQMLHCALPAV